MAKYMLGELYIFQKKFKEANVLFHEAISLGEQYKFMPSWINSIRISAAKVKVIAGEKDIDFESLFALVSANKIKLFEGYMIKDLAEILMYLDDLHMAEAEEWVKKAIEVDMKNGAKCHLGLDYLTYAELIRRKSDLSGAGESLRQAIEIFRECGADGWQQKAENLLADIQ